MRLDYNFANSGCVADFVVRDHDHVKSGFMLNKLKPHISLCTGAILRLFCTDDDSVSLFKCSLSGDLVTTKHQV